MKAVMGQYMNEMISLTIMLLMTIALVAGQADATIHDSVRRDSGHTATTLAASFEARLESTVIRADIMIELDLDEIAELGTELGVNTASAEAIHEFIDIQLRADE